MKTMKPLLFKQVTPKNTFIQSILFFKFLLLSSLVKAIIKNDLRHCENIDFVPGFRYLYGNIHAKNVFFCDTFFIDYAPIYIGENTQFSHNNMVITSWHDFENFHHIR